MFQRFGQILLLVAVLASTGMHWMLLQSVAWASMLANNLQTTTLPTAITRTFDGKHPCRFCKAIATGKRTERKCEFSVSLNKFEFVLNGGQFTFHRPQAFTLLPEHPARWGCLPNRPPVPPPRAA